MEKLQRTKLLIGFMLIVSILLMTISLVPLRDRLHKFDYKEGAPWLYPRLDSKFEFGVGLDHATKDRITDSITSNFAKIYSIDAKKGEQQVALLSRLLNSRADISVGMRTSLLQAVKELYAAGIVDNEVADDIEAGKQLRINLGNHQLQVVDTHSIKTVRQAYEWLNDSLADNPILHAAVKSVDINEYLMPNMKLDTLNDKLLESELRTALAPKTKIQAGEAIISRGEIVTPQKASTLRAYEEAIAQREAENSKNINQYVSLIGQGIIVGLLMLMFYYFMKLMRPRVFGNIRRMIFLIAFITVFVVSVFVFTHFKYNLLYIVPFAIVPIIVSTFYDSRTSYFVHITVVLICSLVATQQAEFIIMQFMVGNIAIASMKELTRRSQLARCAAQIFVVYCLAFVALMLVRENTFEWNWAYVKYFVYFAINCVILSFAYVMIFVVEKIFGFTSSMTLVELSDINTPILRRLSESCPGTFQHSLQVANLAGEAAAKIGANLQLARAGALYHDIGKIKNPAFFTENQNGENPHDHLARPEDSAKIVIEHVANGAKLADAEHLPQVIKDMILQHHGKGVTKYFYSKACKEHPDEVVDKAPYTYPGPNPQTKEAAILMMADACEAAAKSLKDPTDTTITALVERIIDGQIADGLLKESTISFKDVETIKQLFVERLRAFYHTRISYPDDVKPEKQPALSPSPTSSDVESQGNPDSK